MYTWLHAYYKWYEKIENADIFIQNGLGLEIFMDKIFTIYPNLKVLDASMNIKM